MMDLQCSQAQRNEMCDWKQHVYIMEIQIGHGVSAVVHNGIYSFTNDRTWSSIWSPIRLGNQYKYWMLTMSLSPCHRVVQLQSDNSEKDCRLRFSAHIHCCRSRKKPQTMTQSMNVSGRLNGKNKHRFYWKRTQISSCSACDILWSPQSFGDEIEREFGLINSCQPDGKQPLPFNRLCTKLIFKTNTDSVETFATILRHA